MQILKLIGNSSTAIHVTGDTIKIITIGLTLTKNVKTIPMSSVTSVEISAPGKILKGFIKIKVFEQSSMQSTKFAGITTIAPVNDNTIWFSGKDNYKIALEIQNRIMDYKSKSNTIK